MGNLVRITEKEVNCFFGYYDKYATDKNDKIHLFHQVDFFNRPPVEKDKAKIGICEIETGKVEIVDETYAWNFQQGSMLQFLDDEKIIYNYREKEFIAKIYNLRRGKVEFLPKAVSALSPDGKYAVRINFSRLAKWRPGYGYEGLKDRFEDEKWPEKDGIYIIDVEGKKAELIIPLSLMLDFRKEKGVEKIIMIGSSKSKKRMEISRKFGVSHIIYRDKMNFSQQVEFINDLTGGKRADIIFEASGTKEAVEMGQYFLSKGGKYIICGIAVPTGKTGIEIYENIVRKNATFKGIWVSDTSHLTSAVNLILKNKYPFDEVINGKYKLTQPKEGIKSIKNKEIIKSVFIL